MTAPATLALHDARKLVLLSQRLPSDNFAQEGHALAATMATLQHLGYVQIDTISVVERAHHHTFWNRTRRYQPAHLESLLRDKKIFEYWSHAAAYLPMEEYRFSLPRMHALKSGARHWYTPDRKMMKQVLERIKVEGALRARDFVRDDDRIKRRPAGMWEWRPAKQALERLFMEGELMILRRHGFAKVYDLTERVLTPHINTRMPSENELGRFLITRFLRANGIGRAQEITYQRSELKSLVECCMTRMQRRGEIVPLQVKDRVYHALPDSLELLDSRLSRKRLKILSPFDNLLIQRERMRHLFDYDYQIECYTPATKRKHGYFSLPLLWNGKLVARMDCKAMRPTRTLVIRNLVCEPSLADKENMMGNMMEALADELINFAAFNHCAQIEVGRLQDTRAEKMLRALINY